MRALVTDTRAAAAYAVAPSILGAVTAVCIASIQKVSSVDVTTSLSKDLRGDMPVCSVG
jgi:hypothetical protein